MKGNRGTNVNRLLVMMTVVLSLVILGGGAARSHAQEATPDSTSLGYPELSINATDAGVEMPESVAAGRYLVTLTDATDHGMDAFLLRLPDGVTAAEVDALFASP